MIDRDELRRLSRGELAPRLEALEAQRRIMAQSRGGYWLVGLVAVGVGLLLARSGFRLEAAAFALIALTVPPVYFLAKRRSAAAARHQAEYEGLVGEVAARAFPGARYGAEGSASAVEVHASGIFGRPAEQCESWTGVAGATSPQGLTFAEVRLFSVKEWHDPNHQGVSRRRGGTSVNRRRETDVFRGLFLAFDSAASMRGATFLDPPRVGAAIASREALSPVDLDDPAFAREYRVTSSDPEEARELLTPSARACFLRLREKADAPVHVSIAEGRVRVAIELRRPVLEAGAGPVGFERLAEIADRFALVELAAAALPAGGRAAARPPRPAPPGKSAETAQDAPGRPARSQTRLVRTHDGLSIVYTSAVSPLMLWLGALGTPVVAISWFLALRAAFSGPGDNSGAFAAMIPLAVFTLFWLFAAQAWWAPVSRVEVAAGELRVTRGRLRTRRRPVGSIQSLKVRRGVLRAGGLALSPKLAGAELRWLAHEIGAALNLPVAGEPRPQ